MRLVVIDTAKKTYTVIEDKKLIAVYVSDAQLTAEDIEYIRTSSPQPIEAA